jgi:outer membrane protein TolC
MKETRPIVLLLLGFLLALRLAAQDSPRQMSLETCIQFAVNNSTGVEKARLEVEKARHKSKEFFSLGLPKVDLNLTFQYNIELPTQQLPGEILGSPGERVPVQFGTDLTAGSGIQLNQMVYNPIYAIGLEGTRKLVEVSNAGYEKSKADIAYEVGATYYQALTAKKQKDILQANLAQVVKLLDLTQSQFDNGLAKKVDVDQLTVSRVNLETSMENLDLQYWQLLDLLKYRMSMPLEQDIELQDTISEQAYTYPALALQPADFSKKPEMTLLLLQRDLNEINVRQLRAGYYPSLYLFGGYNWQGQGNNFGEIFDGKNWFSSSLVGLRLSMPLFDGFERREKIAQARIDLEKWRQDEKFTKQSLDLQHRSARQKLQVNYNNLQSLAQNRRVAEEVYAVSQERFSEGVAPIVELLQAETSMRSAQTNYLTALLQIKLAELELLHARGELLENINQ